METDSEMDPEACTPTFAIATLGCKVNQYESQALARLLEASGWKQAPADAPADLTIVNTCTVTGKASMQSRQAARRAVRASPGGKLLVTGCYAQSEPGALARIDGVDAVVGHADKHRIPELVSAWLDGDEPPGVVWREAARENRFRDFPVDAVGGRSRPFLKIQDGCDTFCTYCIVPYTRGRSRSMPPETVLERLARLGNAGYHEVVLTGIHLGCYGLDLGEPKTDLSALLARIGAGRPVARVRISSVEPQELTDRVIRTIAADPIFCDHFHIPLQSGDNGVLSRMRRPYDAATFARRVAAVRRHAPLAAVGADILVGFPGESEAAFENTRRLVESLPLSYLHVFPYSPRPGTPAARYDDPVPEAVTRERCAQMRALGREKTAAFHRRMAGREAEVLVESFPAENGGPAGGLTANYVRVTVAGLARRPAGLLRVRLEGPSSGGGMHAVAVGDGSR